MLAALRCALAAALMLAAAPAVAQAESIFYVSGGDVYAAQPDGSGAVRVTQDGRNSWPSQADDGTIALADTVDGRIYRLAANGTEINSMTTYGTYDAGKPENVRLSPDGSKIAYRILYYGGYHTWWTPSNATDTSGFQSQGLGQESYGSPSWIGNTDLFLSHNGATVTSTQPAFATYHVGNGENTEQDAGTEPDTSWQGGYRTAISRDGARVVAIEDDGAGGPVTRAELHIFTTNAPVPTSVTLRCSLTLPNEDTFNASPSFSPDGSKVAFAEADGVHVLTLGDLSSCPASAPLVIPNATQPFWGPANPPVIGGQQPGGDTTAPVVKLVTPKKVGLLKALARGLAFGVGCDEPCAASLSMRVDAKTAKKDGLLARNSKAKTVKVASGSVPRGQGLRVLNVRFTRAAKRKLRKSKKLTLRGTLAAVDAAGNRAKRTVTLRLKK